LKDAAAASDAHEVAHGADPARVDGSAAPITTLLERRRQEQKEKDRMRFDGPVPAGGLRTSRHGAAPCRPVTRIAIFGPGVSL
jgi:hypothetical protein